MSHSIIIISAKLDCIKTRFPSLTSYTDGLKQRAIDADEFKETCDKELSEQIHEKLEEVQAYVVERCDNWKAYSGQLSEMEEELDVFIDALDDFMS